MTENTNAHSWIAKQERSPADAPAAIDNLYHLLNEDVREAARGYGLDHDAILAEMFKLMLLDFFAGRSKSHEIHDLARQVYASFMQGCL